MFEAPTGYTLLGGKQRDSMREEEEDLLQFAIQQSLLEAGSEHDQVGPGLEGEEKWSSTLGYWVPRTKKTVQSRKRPSGAPE